MGLNVSEIAGNKKVTEETVSDGTLSLNSGEKKNVWGEEIIDTQDGLCVEKAPDLPYQDSSSGISRKIRNDITGIGTNKKIEEDIKKINEKNVIEILAKYKEFSDGESLIHAIARENEVNGLPLEKREEYINKIKEALVINAKSENINTEYFETCFGKELEKLKKSSFPMQTKVLDNLVTSKVSQIKAFKNAAKIKGEFVQNRDLKNPQVLSDDIVLEEGQFLYEFKEEKGGTRRVFTHFLNNGNFYYRETLIDSSKKKSYVGYSYGENSQLISSATEVKDDRKVFYCAKTYEDGELVNANYRAQDAAKGGSSKDELKADYYKDKKKNISVYSQGMSAEVKKTVIYGDDGETVILHPSFSLPKNKNNNVTKTKDFDYRTEFGKDKITITNVSEPNEKTIIEKDKLFAELSPQQRKSMDNVLKELNAVQLLDLARETESLQSIDNEPTRTNGIEKFKDYVKNFIKYADIGIKAQGLYYPNEDKIYTKEDPATLLHELGHAVDYTMIDGKNKSGFNNNKKAIEVFEKERNEFLKAGGDLKNINDNYAARNIREMFADCYVYLTSGNCRNPKLLVQYFPQTLKEASNHLDRIRSSKGINQ